MGFHLFRVFVLVIFAICAPNLTNARMISLKEKTAIKKGLVAGKHLASAVLKDGKFRDSLAKIGKNLAPFLGALGPLASITLALIPTGDSAELAYMKKQFAEVNNKLDIITSEFAEVKNAIDWSTVVVSYGVYERKIRAAEANLNGIYKVEGQARDSEQKNFIAQYEGSFDNSLGGLYDAIMKNDHVFSKNILVTAVKHTKNHKRKVEQFSLGLVQLLVQAIKVKVFYYGIKGWTAFHVIKMWTSKMNQLKGRLQRVSSEVKGRYKTQLKTDADDLILRHHGLGNKGLLQKIYDFVIAKYDWRYWFVAVYDDMYGFDHHTISMCGGHSLLHQKGKNIIISSQDKVHSSKFKKSEAAQLLRNVENDIDNCELRDPGDRARALVHNAGSKAGNSCTPYALHMAVQTGNGLWYISWNSHTAFRKIEKRKPCCIWNSSYYRGRGRRGRSECISINWYYNMLMFG